MGYVSPYSSSSRWLRGNLHAHTCCSGFMDISESGPIYSALGYDFLAVSDHNMAPDEEQWRSWQDQVELILVPSEENGSEDHILEIGTHSVTPTPTDVFAERAATLRAAGGFVAACHPQQYPHHGEDNVRSGIGALHAFEIFNGLRETRGFDETANVRLWDELLTAGKRVWGIATDDFHFALISPGHGWVCVQVSEDESVNWQLIVERLKTGAFYASTSPSFERLELVDGTLTVHAVSWTNSLRVIGPGGHILHSEDGSKLQWRPIPDLTYFRVEAVCGIKRAWSQPFYPA